MIRLITLGTLSALFSGFGIFYSLVTFSASFATAWVHIWELKKDNIRLHINNLGISTQGQW